MAFMFQVKEISLEQWDMHWQHVPKANLLQSWQYGVAKEKAEGWHALRFLISDNNGHPIAIAQVLTRSLPLLGGIARLNRGPLLLEELPELEKIESALDVLRVLLQEARRRFWWVVQIAPELPYTDDICKSLIQIGLRRRPEIAWASGRMALGEDEKSLLMSLNGKWRNCMRKGERLGVLVEHYNGSGATQDMLISGYAEFQRSKGFEGLSEALLRSLVAQQGKMWQFKLFIARDPNASNGDEPLGMLVTVRHGDTATYIIGYSNDRGRQMQANSVLLWHAILHAKEAGCVWFDIGGLSEATDKGVAEFKNGLNAVPYKLAGEWRWYYLPRCMCR
jgi:hypothetical protein